MTGISRETASKRVSGFTDYYRSVVQIIKNLFAMIINTYDAVFYAVN